MQSHAPKSSTVLTCGALSLTIPKHARVPKLNVRPGSTSVVDVALTNFTGVLTFEVLSDVASGSGSKVISESEGDIQQAAEVPSSMSHIIGASLEHPMSQARVTTMPAFSQPLSVALMQPPPATANTKELNNHLLTSSGTEGSGTGDMFEDYSSSQADAMFAASQALASQPMLASQQVPASSQGSTSQHKAAAQIRPMSQLTPASRSTPALQQLHMSQSHIASQMPDSQLPDSAPSQNASQTLPPSTPPMPHFVSFSDDDDDDDGDDDGRNEAENNDDMSTSPPNDDEDLDTPIMQTPTSLKMGNKGREKITMPPHPSALAQVEARVAKHGKRVRFEERPTIVTSPPLKKVAQEAKRTAKASSKLPAASQETSELPTPSQPNSPNPIVDSVSPAVSPPSPPSSPETQDKEPENETSPTPNFTLTPTASPGQPFPWETVAVSEDGRPTARWGATFTPLDGETVLLVGGESKSEDFFCDAIVYNVEGATWVHDETRPPAMPSARAWHSATRIDDVVFVFGGEEVETTNEERSQCNSSLVYDKTYRTWYAPSIAGTPPTARAGHCAALIPDSRNVLVYGGINRSRWLNDIYVLEDLCSWKKVRTSSTKSARPAARSYASLTPSAGFLVLFGGNNKSRSFNDVHFFVPSSMSWVEPVVLGRAPKPRTGHCAVASKDGCGVIVYGGWDDQGSKRLFYSDVWVLRIESQAECHWTCIFAGNNASTDPGPRAGAAMCGGVGEDLGETLLFGGWYQTTYYNDITRLNVAPNGRVRSVAAR